MTTLEPRGAWLGVIGGLGPLVSAEFLKTIYEEGIGAREQDAPRVLLYSDPSFPDRTSAFLAGEEEPITRQLISALEQVRGAGVARTVICCVTMHHVLPRVPSDLRGQVVSLIDVIADAVTASGEKHLLLCTTGTRRLGLFERHPRWAEIRDRVALLSDRDQTRVHELIYELKVNGSIDAIAPALAALLPAYGVTSFIAGCTEMHFFAKRHVRQHGGGCIDPLFIIARDLEALLASSAVAGGRR
ncbi:MAG TPA: aspartate/glutamate racemase family protein [Vicinamibacterales bacterium]|nr:aspartate/glutamate racemase family protein [Vicinamibacterales bacterium]